MPRFTLFAGWPGDHVTKAELGAGGLVISIALLTLKSGLIEYLPFVPRPKNSILMFPPPDIVLKGNKGSDLVAGHTRLVRFLCYFTIRTLVTSRAAYLKSLVSLYSSFMVKMQPV